MFYVMCEKRTVFFFFDNININVYFLKKCKEPNDEDSDHGTFDPSPAESENCLH
jgi:hypothetical protein